MYSMFSCNPSGMTFTQGFETVENTVEDLLKVPKHFTNSRKNTKTTKCKFKKHMAICFFNFKIFNFSFHCSLIKLHLIKPKLPLCFELIS